MPFFGVHESISDGFDQAVFAARTDGFDAVQIFSKNSGQWRAKPIDADSAERFRKALATTGVRCPMIHDSYLINLASPKSDLLEKSLAALADELTRAAALGVERLVMHPGSYTQGTESGGLAQIAESLDATLADAPKSVRILLETTAGQGTNLGWKFEHLAEIMSRCRASDRLGVCLDTCHIFAAGYDFSTQKKYDALMAEFDRVIGLDRLEAFHLNDSVKGLGSRVDRHEAIGHGQIGREPFGFFVRDTRFARHPMYLETPKGTVEMEGRTESWDVVNLRTLKEFT